MRYSTLLILIMAILSNNPITDATDSSLRQDERHKPPWPTVPVTPHPAVLLRIEIPSLFLGLLRSRLPVAFLCTLKCARS